MKIIKAFLLAMRVGKIFDFTHNDLKKISKAPYTYLEDFLIKFESILEPNLENGELKLNIKEEMIRMLENMPYERINRIVSIERRSSKIHFGTKKKLKVVCGLIQTACRQDSASSLEIIDQAVKDYERSCMQVFTSVEQIQKLEKDTKEEIARGAMSLIAELAEPAYRNYLITISRLYALASNANYAMLSGSLGNIEREIRNQLPDNYHILFSKNISPIRNAKAHSSWKFDAKSGMIILCGQDSKKEIAYSPLDLKAIAEDMIFNAIHLIPLALNLIMLDQLSLNPGLIQEVVFRMLEELKKNT
ncbi:hypothetical protein [Leptospira interrogans]|uniref:hypothetical protein n=1 Tax=Leptospira interrogans TaxID=173 RepID=UPI0002BB4DE1|nr:hypothetical protein [Leptospira interrogans]EMN67359.1 hypothetical protein LEP1GSC098_0361 [Leptospira interrogans serovar Grippotyphosa str. UI 08434]MCR8649941.1 hypothetical protein [Leptospira interrogans serovar Bataviae]OAM85908.1 hypothetical protein A1343_16445 [Leptospira interrogans serovar Bataviae]QOI40843.1 hypothetical protein Lepto1548_21665 [Leptospira interrogans serovar Bataviae]QYY62658.1 hypothetical protein GR153_019720 [Leptospira interrogans serovar Bataviae]